MRILWVTLNRKIQCISHFDNLRLAVEDIAEVTVVIKFTQGLIGRNFAEGIFSGKVKDETLLNSYHEKDFDFLICDSLFAFPSEDWSRFKNITRAYIVEDLHGILSKKQTDISIKNKFNICFTRYLRPLKKFFPQIYNHQKVVWLPHSVPGDYFVEFYPPEHKPLDILLTGSVNSTYPFRQKIEQLYKNDLRFKRVPRYRGVDEINRNPTGMNYLELLNSAKIHPACPSTLNYVVCKYAEIAATNTLIISPWCDELGKYGFKEGQNIVVANINNVKEKIDYYLNNNKKRVKITEAGRKLIEERHTCDIRAKQLIKHLEEL